MKPINEILRLMNRVLPLSLQPTVVVPPQQPVAAPRTPMFQAPVETPPVSKPQVKTGLRPKNLPQHQLEALAVGSDPFPFYLEASWVDAQTFSIEVLCWEFFNGRLEPLTAFTGDATHEVGIQMQPAMMDVRGYYALLQIRHNAVLGTWWRHGTIPRNGRRQGIRFNAWTRAWQDTKPKGLETVEGLAATLALSTIKFEQRTETDAEWAARRLQISNQQARERQQRGRPTHQQHRQQQQHRQPAPHRFAERSESRRYQAV